MASRGSVLWRSLALLAALLPSAASQEVPSLPSLPLPPIDPGSDHMVLAVEVPLAGAAGSGSLQVPVDGGILDIQVDPILLPGPGGTVDVEAYIAQVRLLLPSGVVLPLPSMIIRSEDRAIEGPAAQALADFAASAEALKLELEAMADEMTAPSDPPEEPEPAPEEPDPMAEELAALQAQAEALAAQADWVQSLADEASGAAGAGAAEQAAIAGAMFARAEAGLALLQKGLDSFEAEASALADEASGAAPAPEAPGLPEMPSSSSASESETASASQSADPDPSSGSQAPPSTPSMPDLSAKMEKVMHAVADAQAQADQTAAEAQEARDELAGMVGALGGNLLSKADSLVDEQAAIDGARAAVALAEQALADRQAGAKAMLAELQAELEAAAEEQSQGPRDEADAAALDAQAALDEAIGRLQWARDWVAEAQAMAGAAGGDSLADASSSISSAQRTAEAMAAIVDRYVASQSPAEADELAEQLAAAQQQLDDAIAQAEAAQGDLAAALQDIAAEDPAGGLDPIPDEGSMPGAPGAPEVPVLPSLPGMPVSFDQEAMAICADSLAAQACFHYRSPVDSPPGSLMVLIAIPIAPGALDGLDSPVDLPVDSNGLPIDPDDPLPTSPPELPLPTGLPGLPGPSGSSSTSASSAAPNEDPGSGSSTSSGILLPEASSTSSSTSASATSPHLQATTDRDTLGLRMGEQDSLVMTVRNDGTAADTVRLTAQTDAPITLDMTEESVVLAPGETHDFQVRITPLAAGSGTLDLLATGEQAGSVVDSVLVAVQAAPSPPSKASIAASLDPTAVQSAVGQATAVTIRLANEGDLEDLVSVKVSGQGMRAEPSQIEVLLEAGEAVARQVWITPTADGASQVVMSITSDQGADLQPIVMMDAVGSLMPTDDEDTMPEDDGLEEEPSKDSPGVGILVTAAAVGLAMLARRKLRNT